METIQDDEGLERMIKHAYLYATFSTELSQFGAVIVNNQAIIGMGWNKNIGGIYVSAIETAICKCVPQDATLICTQPPVMSDAKLILLSGIASVFYDKGQRDKNANAYQALFNTATEFLEENDVGIAEYQDGVAGCFNILWEGETWQP